MEYIIGVDIGGTFTDCVAVDEAGTVVLGKALSTPKDFSAGAINAIRDTAQNVGLSGEEELLRSAKVFFHACTIAENTLITRSGAKTGLIATRGFGDTLLMMRGKVTEGLTETEAAHVSALSKPEPFVPRSLTEEVTERVDYKGKVLVKLDTAEARAIIKKLMDKGVESIAVALLWSISNDSHERLLAGLVKGIDPSIFVSLSSDVAPFLGEYERTATTVFNAYVAPKISSYLISLQKVLKSKGLKREPLIMQAYGGVLGMEASCRNAVGTIESGPASGVVGTKFLGDLIGEPNVLATDMGGTTFKVSVIREGTIEKDYKPVFMRYNILSPKIWVESIGAGGGSIAWIEPETGLLKVGPQGAGANPGPVCYGLGGSDPTVSDADLALGYLNGDYFLGGRMRLDKDKACRAIEEKVAGPLEMGLVEAASGIYRIANSHMSDLIRKATVERGYDPRNFTLFAFGGAAPMHAGRYAADLGIKQVVVPLTASVHGATGLISSDVVYEYGKSEHLLVPAELPRVHAGFSGLRERAMADLRAAGFAERDISLLLSVDMRYRYQVHELNVPFPTGTLEITEKDMKELYTRFDELYGKAYGAGSGYSEAGKEILTFRVIAIGALRKPHIKEYAPEKVSSDEMVKGEREVYFEEERGFVKTRIYDFDRMKPGMEIPGPAVIETPVTTIVVNPRDRATMDGFRNVKIAIG